MNVYFEKCSAAVDYATQKKSFGVFHSRSSTTTLNMHTHDCCEILLCVRGGKNFLIDNNVYEVNDGDMFIINQFESHKLTLADSVPTERYVLQLHPEFIFSLSTEATDLSACFYSDRKTSSNKVSLTESELSSAIEIFSSMEKSYGFGDDIIKNNLASRLLILTNRIFSDRHATADTSKASLPIMRAIVYIDEHFGDEITLEDVAKNSYVSVNQLCRIFKSTLGTTVMKYIIGKRISEAKKLLKAGHSVSETALMCGFRDYSNFIRTFSASVGISPGKYSKEF